MSRPGPRLTSKNNDCETHTARPTLPAGYGLALAIHTPSMAANETANARQLHEQLLVLDTHLDTPANFAQLGWSITDRHSFEQDGSQVDLPRMIEGGLDGGFWVIYTSQGPRTQHGFQAACDAGRCVQGELRLARPRDGTVEHADSERGKIFVSKHWCRGPAMSNDGCYMDEWRGYVTGA